MNQQREQLQQQTRTAQQAITCSGSHFKPTVLAFDAEFGSN